MTKLRPALGRNVLADCRRAVRRLYRGNSFVYRKPLADICTLNRNALVTSRFKASRYLSVRASAVPRRRPKSTSVFDEEEDQSAFLTFFLCRKKNVFCGVSVLAFVDLFESCPFHLCFWPFVCRQKTTRILVCSAAGDREDLLPRLRFYKKNKNKWELRLHLVIFLSKTASLYRYSAACRDRRLCDPY